MKNELVLVEEKRKDQVSKEIHEDGSQAEKNVKEQRNGMRRLSESLTPSHFGGIHWI